MPLVGVTSRLEESPLYRSLVIEQAIAIHTFSYQLIANHGPCPVFIMHIEELQNMGFYFLGCRY